MSPCFDQTTTAYTKYIPPLTERSSTEEEKRPAKDATAANQEPPPCPLSAAEKKAN